jgi:transcriptional regulator with XRE-family HTH domain
MSSTSVDPAVLGLRLRELRNAAGFSIEQLAAASTVSRSMVSEVERAGRVPTILTLDRLATALGTSAARLLAPEDGEGVRLLRRGDQSVLREPSWERRILSPVLPGVQFEFMRTVLQPGVDAGVYAPHGAGSREYIAVESGELTLSLDEDQHVLRSGDSIYFPGACHHGFRNMAAEPCVYYLVMDLGSH